MTDLPMVTPINALTEAFVRLDERQETAREVQAGHGRMLTQIAETARGNADSTRSLTIEVRRLADAVQAQNGRVGKLEQQADREDTGERAVRAAFDRWRTNAGWLVATAASAVAVAQFVLNQ